MRSVAYVTTAFPTMTFFIEAEVRRLEARGIRVRVFALRSLRGRSYQPEHASLLPLTRWVGSPLDPVSWLALLSWLMRKPHVLMPEALRMIWASRNSLYALAGHIVYLPAEARVVCIYHGVDSARFDGQGRARASEPLLLAVGRLRAAKAFDLAIRALGLMRTRGMSPRLVIIGDGPERERLRELSQECGVADRVDFRVALSQVEIEQMLQQPALVDRMGDAARARVPAEFDARRNVERLFDLFSEAPRTSEGLERLRSAGTGVAA